MSKRKLIWARTNVVTLALPAAASAQCWDLLQNTRTGMGILLNLPGVTVMRTRLDVFAPTLSAGSFPYTVGVRTATIAEFTELNGDAVFRLNSAPNRDTTADWMLWKACYPNHGADATTGVPNASTYELDVRSMRKMDELSQTLLFMVGKETSTAGFSVSVSASVLLALP